MLSGFQREHTVACALTAHTASPPFHLDPRPHRAYLVTGGIYRLPMRAHASSPAPSPAPHLAAFPRGVENVESIYRLPMRAHPHPPPSPAPHLAAFPRGVESIYRLPMHPHAPPPPPSPPPFPALHLVAFPRGVESIYRLPMRAHAPPSSPPSPAPTPVCISWVPARPAVTALTSIHTWLHVLGV